MKLMFASDIHGSLPATEQLLARFAQSGARWLVLLGDLLYHGPRNALPVGYAPAQVAERLNTLAERIIAVRGNCDSEVDQMLLHFPATAPWQQVLLEQGCFSPTAIFTIRTACRRLSLAIRWSMAIPIFQWPSVMKTVSRALIPARSVSPKVASPPATACWMALF